MSNSKLTADQKRDRKEMIENLPEGSSMALSALSGVTYLVVPDGSLDRVYTSVACPNEAKIRRKVGEYHALVRWFEDTNGIILPAGLTNAEDLANQL